MLAIRSAHCIDVLLIIPVFSIIHSPLPRLDGHVTQFLLECLIYWVMWLLELPDSNQNYMKPVISHFNWKDVSESGFLASEKRRFCSLQLHSAMAIVRRELVWEVRLGIAPGIHCCGPLPPRKCGLNVLYSPLLSTNHSPSQIFLFFLCRYLLDLWSLSKEIFEIAETTFLYTVQMNETHWSWAK